MSTALLILMLVLVVVRRVVDYQNDPMCRWCEMRHQGRCIFYQRAASPETEP